MKPTTLEETKEKWDDKRGTYLFIAFILFVVGTCILIYEKTDSYSIATSELQTVENLIISKSPEFKETKGKHGQRWIEFECVNYDTRFQIANFDYKCVIDEEILGDIKLGDTVSIQVLKDDLDLLNDDRACEIHALVAHNKDFLDLGCRNFKSKKDIIFCYVLCYILAILLGAMHLFKKKPKIFDHIDSGIVMWILVFASYFLIRSVMFG